MNNFFRTHHKFVGKFLKVIADNCSSNNIVGYEMVQQLGLKRLGHPFPYRTSWLEDDNALEVKEKCLFGIHICQYKDQVLWDIMDMSSHHIFLGRPS